MNRITREAGKVNKRGSEALRLPSGKVVGRIRGDAAEFAVKRSKHYFRAVGGYSLDAGIIGELQRLGIQIVVFAVKETGERCRVPLSTFLRHARRLNYGFGDKLACPERFYDDSESPAVFRGMTSTCQMPHMGA